jgi:hypothetical protein
MHESVQAFSETTILSLDRHDFSKSALLSTATKAGDLPMLKALLDSASQISAHHLERAFDYALEADDEGILQLLATHPKLSTVRETAMLATFRSQYFRQKWTAATRLLDLGLRPLQASVASDWLPLNFLTEGSLPVLEKVIQIEPPTEENIRVFFRHPSDAGERELGLAISLSRTMPGHQERMSEFAFWCVDAFIYHGSQRDLRLVLAAFQGGGTLVGAFEERLLQHEFLSGNKWRERRDHLIDLIGALSRAGLTAEVAVLARIKRWSLQGRG